MIRTHHPARNRSFRDVESQLEQLPADAGCSPAWVFCDHTEDQLAHFPADWLPSNRMARTRDPAPVQPKPSPMPANHGLRADKDQRFLPARANLSQNDQNSRSTELSRGRGRLACRARSYCRSARFSRRSSSRELKTEKTQPSRCRRRGTALAAIAIWRRAADTAA